MRIHYFSSASEEFPMGNFGDELNAFLWPKIVGDLLADRSSDWAVLIGIGTILNASLSKVPGERFVLGSGAGYGDVLSVDEKLHILAVRGPLTAAALQVDPAFAVTDSALLIRNFMDPSDPFKVRHNRSVAFMPHWTSDIEIWREITESAGLYFIDPTLGVERILSEIYSSKILIAEAMHGVIVADALRVPWIAARTWPGIHREKWIDWTQSMELEYFPENLFLKRFSVKTQKNRLVGYVLRKVLARRLRMLAKRTPQLSKERVLARRLETLNDSVTRLRKEIKDQKKHSSVLSNGMDT